MLLWMRLADRQGKSLEEALASNTHSELLLWKAYWEWEYNHHTPTHYYLAQIAREVHCVLMGNQDAQKFPIEKFLIPFKFEGKRRKRVRFKLKKEEKYEEEVEEVDFEESEDEQEEKKVRMAALAAKMVWCGRLGLNIRDVLKADEDAKANRDRGVGGNPDGRRYKLRTDDKADKPDDQQSGG